MRLTLWIDEPRSEVAIELFHWEYRPPLADLPYLRRYRKRPVPNFGDEIGPVIVRAILRSEGLPAPELSNENGRLISVGSVLHLAASGDHVWGSGLNAKRHLHESPLGDLRFHAVRGPQTAQKLAEAGIDVPRVFGDPGLLLTAVPEYAALQGIDKTRHRAVIPNFNDLKAYRRHPDLVSPLQDPLAVAREIARSEFVVGSSLHAMVFADALGVPSRLVASGVEHPFKYDDYYLGSGREKQLAADSIGHAMTLGPVDRSEFDPAALLEAFPRMLFR